MVVPPAADGGVGAGDAAKTERDVDAPDDASEPTGGARSSVPTVVAAVLSILIVASLALLVTRLVSDTDSDESFAARVGQVFVGSDEDPEQSTRDVVMRQASQFMLRFNTYGPSDLDANNEMPAYAERVSELMSAKLKTGFEQNDTLAEQTVSKQGVGRMADLFSSGVKMLDSDTATVLVAGSITTSYPSSDPDAAADARVATPAQTFRVEVDLVKTDGTWLVDNFNPVTSPGQEEAEDSLAQPTEQPSTGQPSAGQPSTGQPSAGQPSTGQPSAGQPSRTPSQQPTGGAGR